MEKLNTAFESSYRTSNMFIIKDLIEKGINEIENWNLGLKSACEYAQPHAIHLMIKLGATNCAYCQCSVEEHLNDIKNQI